MAAPPDPVAAPHPRPIDGWALAAMAFAAADLSSHLFRNWVAFNEGALGMASRLVREGRWPHADFADVYSGGLALLGAGAQALLGDHLPALRVPFALATVAWVGLLAACARRFLPAPAAAGIAVVGYLWGPPLFAAAMPSWYLLFLATALCWALLRWDETTDVRWWGAAGVVIGLGLAIKINALFLLAAAGTVLLLDERHRTGLLGRSLVPGGVAGAVVLVASGWPWPETLALIGPLVALALAAARGPGQAAPSGPWPGWRSVRWLALGVATVVAPWVLAYAVHGGLRELWEGLFILPFRRPQFAALLPPPFQWSDLLPILLLPALLLPRYSVGTAMAVAAAVLPVTLLLVDAATSDPVPVVRGVWRVVRGWAVLTLLAAAFMAWRVRDEQSRRITMVAWVAAWFALLQYPFAGSNYLAYVAAPILLTGAGIAAWGTTRPIGAAIAGGLAFWSLAVDHGQSLAELGFTRRSPQPPLAPLTVPHGGGLLVPPGHAALMARVVTTLDRWEARTLVAGPDAPQIYYFSGRPMPDREFFEFLAPEWSAAEFARRIDAHAPDAAVLNAWAPFSPVPLDSVVALLIRPPVADTTIGPYRMLRFRPGATAGPP